MMKNRTIKIEKLVAHSLTVSFLIGFCMCSTLFGQYNGYLGKKNVIEFFGVGHNPTFSNFLDEYYISRPTTVKFTEEKDQFDFGFRFGFSHSFNSQFALGIEAGFDYFSVDRDFSQNNFSSSYKHEGLDIAMSSIMPKLIFSGKGSLQPMGISHQVGFGFVSYNVRERDYMEKGFGTAIAVNEDLFQTIDSPNYEKPKGFVLMYALNMRTPISKSLFFTYGIRYQYHILRERELYTDYIDNDPFTTNPSILTKNELGYMVHYRKKYNFIQAQIGLAFAL
jgi:hypothetical protein